MRLISKYKTGSPTSSPYSSAPSTPHTSSSTLQQRKSSNPPAYNPNSPNLSLSASSSSSSTSSVQFRPESPDRKVNTTFRSSTELSGSSLERPIPPDPPAPPTPIKFPTPVHAEPYFTFSKSTLDAVRYSKTGSPRPPLMAPSIPGRVQSPQVDTPRSDTSQDSNDPGDDTGEVDAHHNVRILVADNSQVFIAPSK